ncbi:head-tail connector protein [Sphingomonas endolithica]|uniref:head-tail connector protein n=1 Tax=Sphingomonas endolithica TaxID=2972485 RepID=UPI0021AF4B30|nr:head-tail connector protein [Sphingomonas sp. ZFBP2030]
MRVSVVVSPEPLVTWEDADAHLKLDGDTSEKTIVEGMIAAATEHIDGPNGWLGRAIGVQTLEAYFDTFETMGHGLVLPYPPHIELVGITWRDSNRSKVVGDPLDYELIGDTIYSLGEAAWSGLHIGREALTVKYRAGYETLPAAIRAAILLMVGDLFRNRTTVLTGLTASPVPMSTTVENLLSPFRVF